MTLRATMADLFRGRPFRKYLGLADLLLVPARLDDSGRRFGKWARRHRQPQHRRESSTNEGNKRTFDAIACQSSHSPLFAESGGRPQSASDALYEKLNRARSLPNASMTRSQDLWSSSNDRCVRSPDLTR